MAIPEYPITRREQYLDAIATNDTSVLPAEPITRTEQYLDAIARNGGGGGSSGGVLVVHDVEGTLDKTWQEIADADFCVLKFDNGNDDETNFTFAYPIGVGGTLIGSEYGVTFFATNISGTGFDDPLQYITDTATGYPVWADV